jgi:acyl CoA:acetate/3-ketoacid CoA transferase alpha subunit
MVLQGIHKLVVMVYINFKDHALIKRWQANEKMNVTSKMFKHKKNEVTIKSSLHLLLEVVCIFEVLEFTTL